MVNNIYYSTSIKGMPAYFAERRQRIVHDDELEDDAYYPACGIVWMALIAIIVIIIGLWAQYDLLNKQRTKADCTIGNVELIKTNVTKNQYIARLGITYNQLGKNGIFYIYSMKHSHAISGNWEIYSKIPYWLTTTYTEAMRNYNYFEKFMQSGKIVNQCQFDPQNVANIYICLYAYTPTAYSGNSNEISGCNNQNYIIIAGISAMIGIALSVLISIYLYSFTGCEWE
jgi:hypothetical protein